MARELVKVIFYLERDADGFPPVEVESMWAAPHAEGYRLENIPFYAKGVALGDVVQVERDTDGLLMFKSVVRRGGHSTFRIALLDPTPEDPLRTVDELRLHGFGVEYDLPILLSIDIPPTVSLEKAEEVLFAGLDAGRWELQEGYRALVRLAGEADP